MNSLRFRQTFSYRDTDIDELQSEFYFVKIVSVFEILEKK